MAKPSKKKTSTASKARKQPVAKAPVKAETAAEETPPVDSDAQPPVDPVADATTAESASAPAAPVEGDAPETERETAADPDDAPVESPPVEDPAGDAPTDDADAKADDTADTEEGDEPDEEEAAGEIPSADADSVMLGEVQCRVRKVQTDVVLAILGAPALERVEALQHSEALNGERKRALATDGRVTPAIFEEGADEISPPILLHGFDSIAAAKECGVNDIAVVIVPHGKAKDVEGHIVDMVRKREAKPEDDDDLTRRVHAHYAS